MLILKMVFLIALQLMLFISIISAQSDTPSIDGNSVKKISQEKSLKDLPANNIFSSVDGKFTIALPKDISGFAAMTPQNVGLNASGSSYNWRVREGLITVWYLDLLEKNFSVKSEQDYVNLFAGAIDSTLDTLKAKLISSMRIKLGKYNGIKFDFQLANGKKGSSRSFLVAKRQYTLLSVYSDTVSDSESLIVKAFDTFSLISQESIDTELKRRIEKSTPNPLPQETVSQKLKSDAEDENLKGKVKSIIEESEDLSGTWSFQGRHFSSILDFNEKGYRIKQVLFDSKANPFQITAFGYIDSTRVSKSNMVSYEYDPPPISISGSSNKKVDTSLDSRYEYKLEYTYFNGNLAEMQMIRNNGSKGLRYVYNRKGNQVEELVYSEDGKLNQKYLLMLDDKGNEIERTDFDIVQIYGERKYTVKYESFDGQGNWTKKTTLKLENDSGKQIYKPWYISYRTITYYP